MLRNLHLKPAGLCASATIVLSRVAAFSLDRPPPDAPARSPAPHHVRRLLRLRAFGLRRGPQARTLRQNHRRPARAAGAVAAASWEIGMGEGPRRLLGLRRGRREGQVADRQAGAGRLAGAHRWRHDALQARRALAPRTFSGARAALAMDGRAACRKSKARRRAFSIFSGTRALPR